MRIAIIPLFLKQIRSSRAMQAIQPEMRKIQEKYKGKKDQYSREAMSRETMALYSRHGTNPLSSCLPLLLQMPIFFSLYSVLINAAHYEDHPKGVGLMNETLTKSFGTSEFLGAPLHASIQAAMEMTPVNVATIVIAATMVVLMTTSQFITQLQMVSKNMSEETKASPMFRQQRILLYILPLVFLFSGFAFPIGVMFYWLVSNFWTAGQQFIVIRNMPTPGSEAALAREARLARRAQRRGITLVEDAPEAEPEAPKSTQRQQPVNKNRAKKKSGGNGK